MISWWWCIPVFLLGAWIGGVAEQASDRKTRRGFGLGVVATLLAFIGIS